MASSGSFNTSAYQASDGSRYLTFSWEETSQNVANNTTTIKWYLKGGGTSSQYIYAGNFKVVIAGQTVYSVGNDNRIQLKNGTVVASGTFTFTHKDDGTQGFTASAEGGVYWYEVNCTGSGTFTLDTIARASQPSLVTFPETTNDIGYFGDTISIHMNRKSSTFTHTVRYEYGTLSGTCINAETGKAATGIGTGFKWKIPESFMDLLPATTSGSGRIYVDTYNGSTLVGTKYTGFTAKVPASVKPTCTIQVLDNTNIQQRYGNLVKGLSKLYVKTNFYAAYSSPVDAYNVTANGAKYSAAEIVTGFLTSAGTTTITATVTDKRRRTSDQATASFTVLDYSPPKITAISVHRCNADGTTNDRGECVEILFSGSVSPINDKNSAEYTVKYKKTSAASWTTLIEDVNGQKPADLEGNYNVNNQSYIFAADVNSSYDIDVTVKDDHGTASRSTSASTAFTLMNFNARGNGIGIGQVCEKENTLQIGLGVEIGGKTIIDMVYPVGSIYMAYNHTNPGTLFPGTTWVRMANTFLWGVDASGTIGQTGGAKEVTLTANQIPSHNHGGTYTNAGTATKTHAWLASGGSAMAYDTVNTGGGAAHNNMPPYTQVSIWRRTA